MRNRWFCKHTSSCNNTNRFVYDLRMYTYIRQQICCPMMVLQNTRERIHFLFTRALSHLTHSFALLATHTYAHTHICTHTCMHAHTHTHLLTTSVSSPLPTFPQCTVQPLHLTSSKINFSSSTQSAFSGKSQPSSNAFYIFLSNLCIEARLPFSFSKPISDTTRQMGDALGQDSST